MAAGFKLEDFQPVKAADVGAPKSILIYGPPKRGKSTCAASIVDVAGYERVLVIDVEGGATAISQWYPEVDIFEVKTPEAFDGIIAALVNGKIKEPVSGLPYQAVIIDTLDKAQERKLEWFDTQPDSFTKNGEKNTLYKWGAIKAWTSKLADALHMCDELIIFVAHVLDDKDEKTGKVTQTVALGGASKQLFPSTPDIVGYFDIVKIKNDDNKVEQKRVIDFSLNDKRVTGQRYADKLNGQIGDPTMEKIYAKLGL